MLDSKKFSSVKTRNPDTDLAIKVMENFFTQYEKQEFRPATLSCDRAPLEHLYLEKFRIRSTIWIAH